MVIIEGLEKLAIEEKGGEEYYFFRDKIVGVGFGVEGREGAWYKRAQGKGAQQHGAENIEKVERGI